MDENFPPPPCAADLDSDGGFGGVLAMLAAWGPCPIGPCPTSTAAIGFGDLLQLLTAWDRASKACE